MATLGCSNSTHGGNEDLLQDMMLMCVQYGIVLVGDSPLAKSDLELLGGPISAPVSSSGTGLHGPELVAFD